jgi:hypothetical protein
MTSKKGKLFISWQVNRKAFAEAAWQLLVFPSGIFVLRPFFFYHLVIFDSNMPRVPYRRTVTQLHIQSVNPFLHPANAFSFSSPDSSFLAIETLSATSSLAR